MPRKAQVQRSAEEKFAIVIEGLKSGNIAETCRNHNLAATLFYRWKGIGKVGYLDHGKHLTETI